MRAAVVEPILGKRGRAEMEAADLTAGREEAARVIKKCRGRGYVRSVEVARWAPNVPEMEGMMAGVGLRGEEEGGSGWTKVLPLLSMAPWERVIVGQKDFYRVCC